MFFTFRIVKGYVGKWSPVDRIFFFLKSFIYSSERLYLWMHFSRMDNPFEKSLL